MPANLLLARIDKHHHYFLLALLCATPWAIMFSRTGFEITCGLIAVLFLLRSAVLFDWKWLARNDIKIALLGWVYIVVHSFISIPEQDAIKSLALCRFILFYAATTTVIIRDTKTLQLLLYSSLVAVLYMTVAGLIEYIKLPIGLDTIMRLSGPLNHYNLGNYILKIGLPTLGGLIFLMLYSEKKQSAILLMLMALVCTATIILSGERSIAILTILALSIYGFMLVKHKKTMLKHVILASVLVICLLAIIYSTQESIRSRIIDFIRVMGDFWNHPYGQLYMSAVRMWSEYPIFGVGFKQFFIHCSFYNARGISTYCDIHAHNYYMQWLSEFGIVGVMLFLAFVYYSIKTAISNVQGPIIIRATVIAGLAVLFFPLVGTQSFFSNWPAMLFWYSLSLTMSLRIVLLHDKR